MIALLFILVLFFIPNQVLAQVKIPDPSTILRIDSWYAEPPGTTFEFDVYIDGKLYSGDVISGVSPGAHHLKCTKTGYLDYETTFEFPIESVRCYLSKTATLTINVRDGSGNKIAAKVTIDGKPKGEFDGGAFPMAKGLHKIECKTEGYKKYSSEVAVTNYVPPTVGVDTPSYYSLQCVLQPLGFWGSLWDKLMTLLGSLVKR